MKILLTGSTGMVGRNILENAKSCNYEFIIPSKKELDLRIYETVFSYLKECRPNIVIHSAGRVGGIKANINNPIEFLSDNLQMGVNIILASFKLEIDKLINLGSSCMYPREGPNPLKESSILTGRLEPTNEGYALAKIVAQRLCKYIYEENSDYNYKTIIPCNLYGRYDNFNPDSSHLISSIIRKVDNAMENNTDVEIWGDGNARREFMYVDDLVDAIYFAIEHYDLIDDSMNIGLGHDYSINDYYKKVGEIMRFNGNYYHNLNMPIGMQQKLVSIEKQNNLGWKPNYNLEDGLKKIIKYYFESIK